MRLKIAGDHHAPSKVLWSHELRHLLEVGGVANILLRELHPAVWPLSQGVGERLLIGCSPREVQLQNLWHGVWVLARGASTFGELVEDGLNLLVGGADCDDAVAEFARLLGGDWAGGRDIDWWWGRRERPEACALQLIPATGVLHLFAGEELADDLDRLKHARDALTNFGPVATNDMLVERFARAESEPVATRIHRFECCRRLRDRCRVHAPTGAGDARANIALGAFGKQCHHVPHKWRGALLGHPWLEVVGGHHAAEACLLGGDGVVDDFGRTELLEHCGVADLCCSVTHLRTPYSWLAAGLPCAKIWSGTILMRIRCCVWKFARVLAKSSGLVR